MFKKKDNKSGENIWKISLTDMYRLWRPNRYNDISLWYKWAELQTKILAKLQDSFPETHMYIRYSTYLPEHYTDIIELKHVEIIATNDKKETVVLLPDCQDTTIWKRLLRGAGLISYARCFFMLEDKPFDWKDTISNMYDNLLTLIDGHSIKEYSSVLSGCPCLCFSLDEDLVIGKVNLLENTIIDILRKLAKEDGLELEIERKSSNSIR